ncbi:MAG: lipocalin-like domain-containing protein [Casimicrobiaceae bacterium]
MNRRNFLFTPLAFVAPATRGEVAYPDVVGGTPLVFPRDHGSHPLFRTEWWYITGWVRSADGNDIGIQVTFFRTRPGVAESSASRFAPVQLLFAHAAIADPRQGRLRHDQRAARAGWGMAEANEATTDVRIDDWSLRLAGDIYTARVVARDFAFTLNFAASQPVMLQGDGGVSRKGRNAAQASFYYSRPQLAVDGTLSVGGDAQPVRGTAWLDHEWSSAYLAAEARGWDWTGINFDDGGALMAFRIRGGDGSGYWTGGTYRDASGTAHRLDPASVRFTPQKRWRSARTGIDYPVAFRVEAGALDLMLSPLFDDQELDSRASVGTVYWEGAVRALAGGRQVGRGYLELTGYGAALRI